MVSMTPCLPQSLGISSAGVEAEQPDPNHQPKSHSATSKLCYLEFNVPRITYSNVINRIKNVDVLGVQKIFFKGLKKIIKMVKNNFFQKSKKKNATAHTRGGPTCQVSDV